MKSAMKLHLDPHRVLGLDILRAAAILFVIIDHGGLLLTPELRKWTDWMVFDGVSVFFALSGFLIGGILIKLLEKGGKFDLLDFWKRRWYRTLPNYFLVLTLVLLIEVLFSDRFDASIAAPYFVFFQNFNTIHPIFFPEAWTLSVEEWFYLFVPLLIFLQWKYLKISSGAAILITAITLITVVTSYRYVQFLNYTEISEELWDNVFRKQVLGRLDGIMFGVLAAYVYHYKPAAWNRFPKVFLIIGCLLFLSSKFLLPVLMPKIGIFQAVFSFTFNSIAAICLLPFLSKYKPRPGFIPSVITFVSVHSYAMYLINLSLIQTWILRKIPWSLFIESRAWKGGIRYLLYWCLVIGIAHLIYTYFETPMTKLRDRK
jgi:peptidoglycan/LPS O-acetylase OafA/YrhL